MAKKRRTSKAKQPSQPRIQNTSTVDTRVFVKGMVKDPNASFQAKEAWHHARNAANNSVDGDLSVIGNEPANLECAKVPYTIIGAVHKYADQWVLYSTDNTNSEIGLFDDSKCEYKPLVNDPCLNFNKKHLITGAAKENFDCTWQVYWDDGNNPSRTLNLDDIPWIKTVVSPPGADCIIYEDTDQLDCEQLRLAPLLSTPCVTIKKSEGGGQLRNGSYQAFIAYTVNEQKVTDYIGVSNVQSLFDHSGTSGSLHITVTDLDQDFDYYELVILSNNQEQQVAKKIGLYSTQQSDIEIDYIDQSLVTVPLETIPLRSPAYEKSEAMYVVNDWLIRQGPTEQFDFNYQPLANEIQTRWICAEYPASYYYKGGNKPSFLRDEQYSFFIRWIYNTGERSSSYHIPGRAPERINGINQFGDQIDELAINAGSNALSNDEMNFQVFNTATVEQIGNLGTTDDGGNIIAKGKMAYWQSSEKYPADRPDIWGNLCGEYIRHHKMPTEEVNSRLELSSNNGNSIRILGVEFDNIAPPVDNDGNIITNIVGYEILRGSREGHRSILAKGIFRNMRVYKIPEGGQTLGNEYGLYPNYPYNDLRPDIFFHDGEANSQNRTDGTDTWTTSFNNYKALGDSSSNVPDGYKRDYFTFHSPELMFRRPFLNAYETRLYGDVYGESLGGFIPSENHPQHRLLRNISAILAGIVGIGYAIRQVQGTPREDLKKAAPYKDGLPDGKATTNKFFNSTTTATTASAPPVVVVDVDNENYRSVVNFPTASTAGFRSANYAGLTVANIATSFIEDYLLPNTLGAADALFTGAIFEEASYSILKQTEILKGTKYGIKPGEATQGFTKDTDQSNLPSVIRAIMSLQIATMNISVGSQKIIDLIYNLAPHKNFAYKFNSHGFYNNFQKVSSNLFRTKNIDSNYIGTSFQEFQGFKVNNLFRPSTVILRTDDLIDNPSVVDTSRWALGGEWQIPYNDQYMTKTDVKKTKVISAKYGALKFNFENQYGQLDGIKQVQMRGCIEKVTPQFPQDRFTSQPIFAGDVYINRYTEKTVMPIFTEFLNGQPDDFVYDYLKRINIPYPRFWMDTTPFDTSAFAAEVTSFGLANTGNTWMPNDLFYLDRGTASVSLNPRDILVGDPNNKFAMTAAYMYTHINGVQDFFVESEYNLAQRDWDDQDDKRHYDVYEYTNIDDMFHADIIKKGNFYKYDLSLSINKFLTQVSSFGNIQPRDYDPYIAENCYQEYPKRLIYSLQAQEEAKKDFWRVFLPNNYRDFKNKVNVIKPINKSGALIFFPYQSPQMFQGLDQLQTDLGTKLTIGDGGLFSQPFQNIVNSDLSNEYGSSESARAVVNTPMGIFYISQAQGKIFHYTGKLENIANRGMKWWFNKYLPSVLIRQYPELEQSKLSDNPVIGIGCQTIYDVNDDIVYFMKKDYKVKDQFVEQVSFENDTFLYRPYPSSRGQELTIGDPLYFENLCWTVSYDPKIQAWISFHDWHPELVLPSINHFLTTKTGTSDTPTCPEGYIFNPVTNICEKTVQETTAATVQIDEILSTSNGACPLDIVIAMDVSGSTNGPNNTQGVINAQRSFVQGFLTDPAISAGMQQGNIQIGFTRWNNQSISVMNPNGFSMSNTVTAAQVATFYSTNSAGGTDVCNGILGGNTELQDRQNSQLGDRTADPDFRSILIVITDGNATNCNGVGNPLPITYGCGFLAIFPAMEIHSVFCDPTSPNISPAAQTIMDSITCTNSARQFTIVSSGQFPANTPGVVATALASSVCGCNCPEGYTLVYQDADGNYTEAEGDCTATNPPICRKVECNCPEVQFGTITESGTCDDIYDVGDPLYVNPDPKLCSYFNLSTTPPSFEEGGLWRHNYRCDLYSNYYGEDYPWEVELVENTGQSVMTLRSIEYQLESYVYKGDLLNGCADDRWHDLDFNFDESIIHNSEQVSGLLRLELHPKEDPYAMIQYPIIGANDIRILYSKEEQKYRFNQFYDITNDRGEFSNAQQSIFITQLNGYIRDLNNANLNYSKEEIQHKKFRHYYNKVLLRRKVSGDRKMLLKLANTKLNLSVR